MEEPAGVFRGDLDVLLRSAASTRCSTPRVPALHASAPPSHQTTTSAPQLQQVPSLAAHVPYYHVPGPRVGANGGAAVRHEAARLKKKLCGASAGWTLALQPSRAKGGLHGRCLFVLLAAASVSAAGALLLLFLTAFANQRPIEVVTEVRWTPSSEPINDALSVISGEFLFPRVNFAPELHDTSSPAFKQMSAQIKNKLDELFASSDLSSSFNGSTVYALRPEGEGVQVLCHLLLVVSEAPRSEADEPANRAGLAFLRGLFHHEGHMWLGSWAVDVQSIVFSGFAARGAFAERNAAVSAAVAAVGWTSWGPWSKCGAGGVQTRGRRCALRNGTGEALRSAEQCVQLGGGDLQIKDCRRAASPLQQQQQQVFSVWRASQPPRPEEAPVVRLCDDCRGGEVCVALVGEQVPSCKAANDSADPTGCGGLCRINTEFCRQLDKDAFRCTDDSHCLESEWRCANKLCIPRSGRCDGHMNCYDHSDEFNCGCNLATHFHCGNRTSCLPVSRRCDAVVDCWDASDESNCTAACVSPAHFTCADGACVAHGRFCDGLADCPDRSDEPFGCGGGCKSGEFRCRNGRCVRRLAVCDNFDTCGDNSDEEAGCLDPAHNPDMFAWAAAAKADRAKLASCPVGQFRCASGECVLEVLRCDGTNDCGDKSDEANCANKTDDKTLLINR